MRKRTRQTPVQVYLSEDEAFVLSEKCKKSGIKSKSAFIRQLILYGYVYDIDYSELREYNTNLARIGNNLNQITKRINQTGNVYSEDVKEVKELMEKIWQSQRSMLSRQV